AARRLTARLAAGRRAAALAPAAAVPATAGRRQQRQGGQQRAKSSQSHGKLSSVSLEGAITTAGASGKRTRPASSRGAWSARVRGEYARRPAAINRIPPPARVFRRRGVPM